LPSITSVALTSTVTSSPLGQLQLFRAAAGDRGGDVLAADVDDDFRHDAAERNAPHGAFELVAGAEPHVGLLLSLLIRSER
jgi:hypothetical protein